MMPRPLLLILTVVWLCAADVAYGSPGTRYVGMLADGTRIEGNAITGWHSDKGQPQLDGVNLFDSDRPLRWLRNTEPTVDPSIEDAATFVEMVGGDRLPGQVIGCQPREVEAGGTPGQWVALVQSKLGLESSRRSTVQLQMQVRVDVGAISRVVWRGAAGRHLPPGTVLCVDGRRLSFRRLRWDKEGVTLLTDDGLRQVPFAEMIEMRLPRRDPWDAYYDELARLDLECAGRLIRLETTDGLVVTTSPAWLHPEGLGAEKDSSTWRHAVQPAWSLDPLYVHFAAIRTWWSFAPEEVPLSRIEPSRSVQHSILGRGWSWQADRNVQGGPLQNGNQDYGWGIGVHATNHLWFELPGMVQAFRTRIGLDRTAGNGGCARGSVYCNEPTGTPLFASSRLIGSEASVDTGVLPLGGPAAGQRSLVLVADAAANDHPAGADPLDIRDTLDWLEPMLVLDAAKLKTEVAARFRRLLPAWDGWDVHIEGGGQPQFQIVWEENNNREERRFLVTAGTGKHPVVFSLQRTLSENDDSLTMFLRLSSRSGRPGHLAVRADGRTIATTPIHYAVASPQRFSVSLQNCRTLKTPLEVVYTPGDEQDRVAWQALEVGNRPTTRTHWVAMSPVKVYSLQGATTKQLSDDSTLVTKPAAAADVYVVAGRTELSKITALRLEVLPSPALSRGGSGTASDGAFVLSRFQAATAAASALPILGRTVRIELPGSKRPPLALAEVQVFSGGENVARRGQARQSSTQAEAVAKRAIDGNTAGDLKSGSIACTAEGTDNPWWEVDLGESRPIERIVVFNRTDSGADQLGNFRISVKDADGATGWSKDVADAPMPVAEFRTTEGVDLTFAEAAPDRRRQPDFTPNQAIANPDPRKKGWSVSGQVLLPHAAVFTLQQAAEADDRVVIVYLSYLNERQPSAIGRFRLLATADDPPIPVEGVTLPLLPEDAP
jgi:hypothetical protein